MEDIFQKNDPAEDWQYVDYDNDGDLDIIISHVDKEATAALLRNDGGNSNNWLGLTLKGKNGPSLPSVRK